MRLVFVRHGEPDYEHDCLTENGRVQAKSTAVRLAKEKFSAIYSSPMGRARETASYTAQGRGLDIKILDFMHEIDWGDVRDAAGSDDAANNAGATGVDVRSGSAQTEPKLEYDGHPWILGYKLLTEEPEYIGSPDWRNHRYFKNNICTQYYEKISKKFDEFLLGYGLRRKNNLYLCEKKCDETIALFAHGGSGSIMLSHVLNFPFTTVLVTTPFGVCSITIIEFGVDEGKLTIPRLELFNDMNHIEKFKKEEIKFEK